MLNDTKFKPGRCNKCGAVVFGALWCGLNVVLDPVNVRDDVTAQLQYMFSGTRLVGVVDNYPVIILSDLPAGAPLMPQHPCNAKVKYADYVPKKVEADHRSNDACMKCAACGRHIEATLPHLQGIEIRGCSYECFHGGPRPVVGYINDSKVPADPPGAPLVREDLRTICRECYQVVTPGDAYGIDLWGTAQYVAHMGNCPERASADVSAMREWSNTALATYPRTVSNGNRETA